VEGIAWGALEKGFGPYVILNGDRVYVDGLDRLGTNAEGKLIRVVGVLAVQRIPAARHGSAGPSDDVLIYRIERAKWEFIERVEWPWLEAISHQRAGSGVEQPH